MNRVLFNEDEWAWFSLRRMRVRADGEKLFVRQGCSQAGWWLGSGRGWGEWYRVGTRGGQNVHLRQELAMWVAKIEDFILKQHEIKRWVKGEWCHQCPYSTRISMEAWGRGLIGDWWASLRSVSRIVRRGQAQRPRSERQPGRESTWEHMGAHGSTWCLVTSVL